MRTFIAIEIPEEIRAKLAQASESIEKSGLVYGTFVNKDNIHLTLKFLGDEVSVEDVEKVRKAFSKFNFESFEVKVGGIGFFPNEDFVKVVWVGVESKKLEELERKISLILSEAGIKASEDFEFYGHLTIARIKGIKNKELFREKIGKINIKSMTFSVNSMSLLKSELTPSGLRYKKLESFKFG